MSTRTELGTVTVPTGTLVIIDAGLLKPWSHDRPPLIDEGAEDEAVRAIANSAVDYLIEGRDAEAAGRAFDRQWHPRYLYDIPAARFDELQTAFSKVTAEQKLDARLVAQSPRISHRRRIDLALEHGQGAGEFQFHGPMAVAVSGLPRDRALRVVGEPNSEYEGEWEWVGIELSSAPVARRVRAGSVGVDWARLMFIDVDALGAWLHEEPVDGLADYLFWGRDAEALAARVSAPRLSETEFGWCDLPAQEAADHGFRTQDARDELGLKVAVDFRPHSDHWRLMRQIRASPTGSGTVEVGVAHACGLSLLRGDGIYDVVCDYAADDRLVRVAVEFR